MKEKPTQYYLFITGDPKGGPWISTGHAVLDLEEETAEGNFALIARDLSWIIHSKMVDGFTLDKEANTFQFDLTVTNIKGVSPFPPVITFPVILPVDELFEATNVPNLFVYVSTTPPPQPPAVKNK